MEHRKMKEKLVNQYQITSRMANSKLELSQIQLRLRIQETIRKLILTTLLLIAQWVRLLRQWMELKESTLLEEVWTKF